jgi:hypothetical protein
MIELAHWDRLTELGETIGPATAAVTAEPARLRALVSHALDGLARRLDDVLPPTLARARQAWDKVDDLTIVDEELASLLAATRRTLVENAASDSAPVRAVAFEGLLALDAARGLTSLAERGLASLIRLRVRGSNDDLLPDGRPFLDLGAALAEAARAWA